MTHGGKRPGAGRPPIRGEAKRSLTITLTPRVLAWLDRQPQSRGETIETLIRRTKSFRSEK